MKKTNFRIDMDLVRKIIKDKGFYFIKAERLFDDHYTGPEFYIVTDESDFKSDNPKFANAVVMSIAQFEPIVDVVNEYDANEDRERHRRYEKRIDNLQDTTTKELCIQRAIQEAMKELTKTQYRRVYLYYFLKWTERDIAEKDKVSYKQVHKTLLQAKSKMKKFFESRGLKTALSFPYI